MQKITVGTITRTAVLLLAIVNQILAIIGKDALPIYDNDLTQFISLGATIVTSVIAWWKNNSFTSAALAGDEVKNSIQKGGE